MKPRTKVQKAVHALMGELPPLTKDQKDYAKAKLFKSHLYKTQTHTTCLDCAHKWDTKGEAKLSSVLLGDTCPKCGATLNALSSPRKRTHKDFSYITLATVVQGFQVFRHFYLEKNVKVGEKARWDIVEVAQNWVNEKGKLVPVAIGINAMGWGYGERWVWGSKLEIRQRPDRYYIYAKHLFPNRKILPIVRRNGYKGSFHNLQPAYFCELILSDPKAETLLKAKQFDLFDRYYDHAKQINKYWPSIKIAIRHSYTVQKASDWLDHLDALQYLHMDIYNPVNICCADFQTEHQRIIDKQNRVRARRKYEKEKKELEQAEINYYNAKKAYFDLCFKQGDLSIAPLQTVKEFYEEGEALHHCVSRYHNHDRSLILSAKKNGKRLETIQVSLEHFNVQQSRGLQNKHTKHHKEIIQLVEQNMKIIRKTAKKAKTA